MEITNFTAAVEASLNRKNVKIFYCFPSTIFSPNISEQKKKKAKTNRQKIKKELKLRQRIYIEIKKRHLALCKAEQRNIFKIFQILTLWPIAFLSILFFHCIFAWLFYSIHWLLKIQQPPPSTSNHPYNFCTKLPVQPSHHRPFKIMFTHFIWYVFYKYKCIYLYLYLYLYL